MSRTKHPLGGARRCSDKKGRCLVSDSVSLGSVGGPAKFLLLLYELSHFYMQPLNIVIFVEFFCSCTYSEVLEKRGHLILLVHAIFTSEIKIFTHKCTDLSMYYTISKRTAIFPQLNQH